MPITESILEQKILKMSAAASAVATLVEAQSTLLSQNLEAYTIAAKACGQVIERHVETLSQASDTKSPSVW